MRQDPSPNEVVTGAEPRSPGSFAQTGVVELRRYVLRPGARATLLSLFDRYFVAGQEDVGMRIGRVFEDLDDPDRFVWWRAFTDMQSRRTALEAFYSGPVWKEHAEAANATMLDVDDVLLLRPTDPPRVGNAQLERVRASGTEDLAWVLTGIVRHAGDERDESRLTTELPPVLEQTFGAPVSTWRTEPSPNSFPALPVRTEPAVVWSAAFAAEAEARDAMVRLDAAPAWRRLRAELPVADGDGVEIMRLRSEDAYVREG